MSTVTHNEATTEHGIILILAAVMPAMAIISLVPVMPLLSQEFSSVSNSEALVPIALTIPALCVAIFSPIAGLLSDRIGRKMLLLFGLLGYAAVGIIPFFLTNLFQIIGSRFVLGIFEAVIMTVSTALIGDYFKGDAREKWIGIQIGAVSVSAIILIALGGALGEFLGSRGPFLLYLIALPIALLVFLKLFEPRAIEKTSASGKNLPWKTLLPLLIITLAVGVFFYTVIVSLGDILLLVEEVSPAQIGLIGAAVNLGVMIAASSFIKLKGNSSGPKLLAIGFALFSIGYVGMGVSSSIAGSVTAAIITSLGAGFLLPCMLAWVMSILEAGDRGKGTGLWTGMFFLGQFVAPLVVVALSGPLAGLSNVLVFYGITAAVLMVAALWASRGAEPLRQNT
ncbi:MFS transporter [Gammaproteobacteria bacterium]|jgi:MFS family permease|nr:MFS transporter [Gammaproteobacteria bacterium]MDC1422717.1 MFS transporter [Gammaproteobacteria bacterium]